MQNCKEWVECTGCKHKAREQYIPTPGSVPCIYVSSEYNMELCVSDGNQTEKSIVKSFSNF